MIKKLFNSLHKKNTVKNNPIKDKIQDELDENTIVIKKESLYSAEDKTEGKKKKVPSILKIMIGFAVALSVAAFGVFFYMKHIYGYINVKSFDSLNNVVLQSEQFDVDEDSSYDVVDPEDIVWNNVGNIKKIKGIINILFIGVDEKEDESEIRGRSDFIMIATIDTNSSMLKLTSITPNTYVQIPGYKDNQISSAYRTGDVPLLEDTLETNFNIQVDGYILIDFEKFTDLIDLLGGVEVTLTVEEANWMNESNHILDAEYRNVEAGTHVLAGCQALGYSRIESINTVNDLQGESGRAWRQKFLLTSIFNEYKNQSITDLVALAPDVLSLLTTDLSETNLLTLLMTAIDLDVDEIQTLTIPVRGSYTRKTVNGMSVKLPDLNENNEIIDAFIYTAEADTDEINTDEFSLTKSNFSLESIDYNTEVAIDILKGYSKLTLQDIWNVKKKCVKK